MQLIINWQHGLVNFLRSCKIGAKTKFNKMYIAAKNTTKLQYSGKKTMSEILTVRSYITFLESAASHQKWNYMQILTSLFHVRVYINSQCGIRILCVHCSVHAGGFCCLSEDFWPDSRPHPYARPAVFSVLALKSIFLP